MGLHNDNVQKVGRLEEHDIKEEHQLCFLEKVETKDERQSA